MVTNWNMMHANIPAWDDKPFRHVWRKNERSRGAARTRALEAASEVA